MRTLINRESAKGYYDRAVWALAVLFTEMLISFPVIIVFCAVMDTRSQSHWCIWFTHTIYRFAIS